MQAFYLDVMFLICYDAGMKAQLLILIACLYGASLHAQDVPGVIQENTPDAIAMTDETRSLSRVLTSMTEENAQQRLARAKELLENGANPDGESGALFCNLPYTSYLSEAQLLLLQYGNQNYAERTKGWDFYWLIMDPSVIRKLLEGGVDPNCCVGEKGVTLLGTIVLRGYGEDLTRLAIEKGASVKPSKRMKHYFSDYTFMIKSDTSVHPEDAAGTMRALLDAGADINALNSKGESLRIFYGKKGTAAARAIGEVLRERDAKLHPDAPSNRK